MKLVPLTGMPTDAMTRILHIIVGLEVGGAEMMLSRLVGAHSGHESYKHSVISLTDMGVVGPQLQAKGVDVTALRMRSALGIPLVIWRLFRLMRLMRPDIVQTWMYHADLLGGLAARLAGVRAVIWGVRSTAIPQGMWSATYWLVRLCAFFSGYIPNKIVCCADSAKEAHIRLRYSYPKMIVIPNGYDFSVFDSAIGSRNSARKALGFNEQDIVIGVVGRFDPLKDYLNFVTAASMIVAELDGINFVMIGRGNDKSNKLLTSWLDRFNLISCLKLIGEQVDVPYYLSAMDIFCLSSKHEAFPNVVVEAMAMKLPCVVTNAGDAAKILGDDDFVVPVMDSASLYTTLKQMCKLSPDQRNTIGERNSKLIREKYDIGKIRQLFENLYVEVLSHEK